jgi:hypothetical protein
MGADPRTDDARWLLDWINRTDQAQFSRRDAHAAAPRGRFRKATDLEPALTLLEEHGWLRRVDADPPGPKGGRPASPRFVVNPVPHATKTYRTHRTSGRTGFCRFCGFCGAWRHLGAPTVNPRSLVTLSSKNGPSRIRPSLDSRPAANVAQRPAHVPRRPFPLPSDLWVALGKRRP